MWKAIRLHPWRLEIVPAAAFGLTVWSAYVFEVRLAWVFRVVPELRGNGLEALPAFAIGAVVWHWFVAFGHNQFWVESERRKRFNYHAPMMQCGVITWGWFAYAFASVFSQMIHRIIPPVIPIPLLFVMLGVGVGITALLERSRKDVPREEAPEPPLPANALKEPRYREVVLDWWQLPSAVALLVFTLVLLALAIAAPVWGIPRETGLLVTLGCGQLCSGHRCEPGLQ